MIIIGHRGAGGLFPENSIRAFREAEKIGCHAVECDIRLSADDHLVVIHDPDLIRLASLDLNIGEMKLDQILKIKLNSGETIPTLEEVFLSVTIPVYVELKEEATVNALSRLLRENKNFQKRTVTISFIHEAIRKLKKNFPKMITGALMSTVPEDPQSIRENCNADFLSLHYDGLEKSFVSLCHNQKMGINVWTPNDELSLRRCLNLGVDSITTDRPDIAFGLFKQNGLS